MTCRWPSRRSHVLRQATPQTGAGNRSGQSTECPAHEADSELDANGRRASLCGGQRTRTGPGAGCPPGQGPSAPRRGDIRPETGGRNRCRRATEQPRGPLSRGARGRRGYRLCRPWRDGPLTAPALWASLRERWGHGRLCCFGAGAAPAAPGTPAHFSTSRDRPSRASPAPSREGSARTPGAHDGPPSGQTEAREGPTPVTDAGGASSPRARDGDSPKAVLGSFPQHDRDRHPLRGRLARPPSTTFSVSPRPPRKPVPLPAFDLHPVSWGKPSGGTQARRATPVAVRDGL